MAYPSSFVFHENVREDGNKGKRHGSIPPLKFKPSAHIFYSHRIMDVQDGIPKWAGHKNASEKLPEV